MAERADTGAGAASREDTVADSDAGSLAARAPLGLGARTIELREITDRALVTIVTADAPVRERLERVFESPLPGVGTSSATAAGERLLGLQADRLYVLFAMPGGGGDPERVLRERIGAGDDVGVGAGDEVQLGVRDTPIYLNDQSDSWVMLRIDGAASRRALERVCPLDLHPDAFAVGAVARSVVEHLGVIVLREHENAFVLLSPRSSADSFLHEIETSIRHVGGAPGA